MKTNKIIKRVALLGMTLGLAAFNAMALDYTWDADLTIPDAQDGNGTWTAEGLDFWNGTANAAAPAPGGHVIILGKNDGGYTVTISNGGDLLEYATATAANTLRFNRSYNLAGATAGDGLLIGNIEVNNNSVVGISAVLSSVNTRNWDVGGGSTLNLSGGGDIQRLRGYNGVGTGSINFTGGEWNTNGLYVGTGNTDLKVVQSGGTISLAGAFFLDSGAGNIKTEYELSGGNFNVTTNHFNIGVNQQTKAGQAVFTVTGGTLRYSGGEFRIGNDQGSGIMNITGGRVESNTGLNVVLGRQANSDGVTPVEAELNISGGVTVMQGINFGANSGSGKWATGSKLSVNLTAGELYLKSGGIMTPADFKLEGGFEKPAMDINLGGGILGAIQNWTSSMNMTLTGSNGNINFKAADEASGAHDITLNGVLSGDGGLTKIGGGILLLGGANVYTGNTVVNAGTLTLGTGASLLFKLNATGDINTLANNGGIVTLNGSINIDVADYATGSTWDLFDGTVGFGAGFSVNGWQQEADGLWSFGTDWSFDQLSGVLTVIPEPSTWALLGIGTALLYITRRRNP
jgi:autotransporter-associated beta strand protein